MVQNKKLSPQQLGWVCALVAASTPLTTSFSVLSSTNGIQIIADKALAKSQLEAVASLLLVSIPSDIEALAKSAKIKIASSNSMVGLSNAVKNKFTAQYSGSSIEVNTTSAKKALDDVAAGKSDLAAIGRPLTPEEKAQGLVAQLVGRDKIAVVVNPDNPFKKDLTIPKFAQIFRGELTDWSQLGGNKGKITFIDRISSDTRQALAGYPAFSNAPLTSGKEAVKLDDTSMKALANSLKGAALSFVPANQAKSQPGMRALTMHGVLPTDVRYPFSQPLYYVYKNSGSGDGMNNNVKAFLGFLSTEAGQTAAQTSGIAQSQIPGPDKTETIAAGNGKPQAAKLDAQASDKKGSEKVAGTDTTVQKAGEPSGLANKSGNLSASNSASNNGIAPENGTTEDSNGFLGLPVPSWLKWLLPLGLLGTGVLLLLLPNKRDQPAKNLATTDGDRLDPIAGASDAIGSTTQNPTEGGGAINAGSTAIVTGAAIGGLAAGAQGNSNNSADETWSENDGAPYIRDETDLNSVDRTQDGVGNEIDGTATPILGAGAGAGGAAATGAAGIGTAASWSFIQEEGALDTHATTDAAADAATDAAKATADKILVPPHITVLPVDGPSNLSVDQNWSFDEGNDRDATSAASSLFDRLKGGASNLAEGVTQAGVGVAAAAAGAAVATGAAIGGTAEAARTRLVGDRAGIVIVPQSASEAVVRWQVSEAQKRDAKQQGGQYLALRLYDVTGINPNNEILENFYQYDCNELTQELRIEIPVPSRDYVVEVGYVDRASEWYSITRSLPVHIASA